MARILLLLAALAVGFVLLIAVASETGGEVVKLQTKDASGAERNTSLWVVDHGGFAYLRAGNQEAGWYGRLAGAPRVTVVRDGIRGFFNAERAPEMTRNVDQLMAEKYGWADSVVGIIRNPEKSMAVRLVPAT